MHSQATIEKCRGLRRNGFTLGEIVDQTGLPKTTVYYHIQDIPLSSRLKERLAGVRIENAKKLAEFSELD